MTPTEFAAWVGGVTAALYGTAKAAAYFMEVMGLRPADRRADRMNRLEECEREVDRLKERVHDLEADLEKEQSRADYLERILRRGGFIKTEKGYEGEPDDDSESGGKRDSGSQRSP